MRIEQLSNTLHNVIVHLNHLQSIVRTPERHPFNDLATFSAADFLHIHHHTHPIARLYLPFYLAFPCNAKCIHSIPLLVFQPAAKAPTLFSLSKSQLKARSRTLSSSQAHNRVLDVTDQVCADCRSCRCQTNQLTKHIPNIHNIHITTR